MEQGKARWGSLPKESSGQSMAKARLMLVVKLTSSRKLASVK
jgi:hypothetical protein